MNVQFVQSRSIFHATVDLHEKLMHGSTLHTVPHHVRRDVLRFYSRMRMMRAVMLGMNLNPPSRLTSSFKKPSPVAIQSSRPLKHSRSWRD